ncbi:MAG: hypothetical protein KAJ17_08815, partial [Candidatus Krumholzibacteria bacterium]|nr:hypothetical protein [Candidatus Krumholzibacteria bacterium]
MIVLVIAGNVSVHRNPDRQPKMIKVENIHKRFKLSRQQKREMGRDFEGSSVDAVDGVSFECIPGRIFSLLGPNGAG